MSNIVPYQELESMAAAIAQSGLFGMKNKEQALALMLVAQAEGQHPATITQDYDIIQGRAARKTHSVLANFQRAGGTVEWHELTDKKAEATFSHKSGGSLRMAWTIEQARAANLTGKDNWKNYPRAMLRARLIAEGVRSVFPAALGGMLVAEEAADLPPSSAHSAPKVIDPATGDIKEFSVTEALDEVHAAQTIEKLQEVWAKRGSEATAAKDRGGYRALIDAVNQRKAELQQAAEVTDV